MTEQNPAPPPRWKSASAVLGILLVVSNAVWASVAVYCVVRSSRQALVRAELEASRRQTLALLDERFHMMSRAEVESLCSRIFPRERPVAKGDTVWVGALGFTFGPDGRVTRVQDQVKSPPER